MDFPSALQQHLSRTFAFPDDYHMAVPELKLLSACLVIAKRLQIDEALLVLASQSPFSKAAGRRKSYEHLPAHLRPTPTQLSVAHHPILDLFPWPPVRDRLISVLALRPEVQPPGAVCPHGLMDLVYDMEDGAEGVRVWGEDPSDWRNWEVGERVFGRWWWAFDGETVRCSNERRVARGAAELGRGRTVSGAGLWGGCEDGALKRAGSADDGLGPN